MVQVIWTNCYGYCSAHNILLVGEGDFSFSLCLATAFGSAFNIVATSLDSYAVLLTKYRKAQSNVEKLKKMGATILHGIDATLMKDYSFLINHKFDRIVFNFPHAGFMGKEDNPAMISLHQDLLLGFFKNASQMLQTNGEIHVRHKISAPFCYWDLPSLAARNSLTWHHALWTIIWREINAWKSRYIIVEFSCSYQTFLVIRHLKAKWIV